MQIKEFDKHAFRFQFLVYGFSRREEPCRTHSDHLLLEFRIVTINPCLVRDDYVVQIVSIVCYLFDQILAHFNAKVFFCGESKHRIHRAHTPERQSLVKKRVCMLPIEMFSNKTS